MVVLPQKIFSHAAGDDLQGRDYMVCTRRMFRINYIAGGATTTTLIAVAVLWQTNMRQY